MSKASKKYNYFTDGGHGWLAVKRKELETLGLLDKISNCSYQRGETVYLEEDCDMGLFFKAKGWGNSDFLIEKYTERCPIRSYKHFSIIPPEQN